MFCEDASNYLVYFTLMQVVEPGQLKQYRETNRPLSWYYISDPIDL